MLRCDPHGRRRQPPARVPVRLLPHNGLGLAARCSGRTASRLQPQRAGSWNNLARALRFQESVAQARAAIAHEFGRAHGT